MSSRQKTTRAESLEAPDRVAHRVADTLIGGKDKDIRVSDRVDTDRSSTSRKVVSRFKSQIRM
jgi:hypothetical protein